MARRQCRRSMTQMNLVAAIALAGVVPVVHPTLAHTDLLNVKPQAVLKQPKVPAKQQANIALLLEEMSITPKPNVLMARLEAVVAE